MFVYQECSVFYPSVTLPVALWQSADDGVILRSVATSLLKKKNHIWSLERAWYGWWIVRHRLGLVMLDSGQHDEEEDLNTNSNWTRKYIGTVMDQTPIVNFPTELLIWKQEVLQQEQWTVKNLGLNWASVRDFHKIVVNSATSPNNLFFLSLMKSHDVRFEHQPQWKRDFLVMPASLGCDKN